MFERGRAPKIPPSRRTALRGYVGIEMHFPEILFFFLPSLWTSLAAQPTASTMSQTRRPRKVGKARHVGKRK
eukprot:9320472-Prorocentrum_lima.AAC.1